MRKVKDSDITSAVASLKVFSSNRLAKYHRNYRRYNYTPFASLNNIKDPSVVGYYEQPAEIEEDTSNSFGEHLASSFKKCSEKSCLSQ